LQRFFTGGAPFDLRPPAEWDVTEQMKL